MNNVCNHEFRPTEFTLYMEKVVFQMNRDVYEIRNNRFPLPDIGYNVQDPVFELINVSSEKECEDHPATIAAQCIKCDQRLEFSGLIPTKVIFRAKLL